MERVTTELRGGTWHKIIESKSKSLMPMMTKNGVVLVEEADSVRSMVLQKRVQVKMHQQKLGSYIAEKADT